MIAWKVMKEAKSGVVSAVNSTRKCCRGPGYESGGWRVGIRKEKLRNARQFGGGARLAGKQGG